MMPTPFMLFPISRTALAIALGAVLAFCLAPVSDALAEPHHPDRAKLSYHHEGGSGHGSSNKGHGYKSHGGKHGKGHTLQPHNGAVHFLKMADRLGLDDGQVHRLQTMRDQFSEAHAVHLAQLKAAQGDLQRVMYTDTVNLSDAKALLATIDTLENTLWPAFIEQIHDIKAMLDDGQRQRLSDMHRHGHK